MKLFLLKRNISQYTFPNILLGCFTNLEKAEDARKRYLAQYQLGKKIDPWKEQANKDVDLDKDVEAVDNLLVVEVADKDDAVFVVNSYSEGFGQIVRRFFALCGTEEAAKEKLHEMRKGSSDTFPEYFRVERIVLDELYSDDNLQDNYWLRY